MSLYELARRARDKAHPPSEARLAAQQRQLAAGNAPWHTRLPDELRADRCWDPLMGPAYRQRLLNKLEAERED